MIREPKEVLFTDTDVCEDGAYVTGLAPTTLWRCSSAAALAYSWSASNTALRISIEGTSISMSLECHGKSLRSAETNPWTIISKNHLQNR